MPKVVIRLPAPRVQRDAKGRPLPAPKIDRPALWADLRARLEPQLRGRYGEDVELGMEQAAFGPGEVKLVGVFPEKGAEVRRAVGEMLEEAMGALDPGDYVLG